MGLTSTNAKVSIADSGGPASNQNDAATALVMPSGTCVFALQSTSGIQRWELRFSCPSYPSLHNREFLWLAGQANSIAVNIPSDGIGVSDRERGISYTSVVSDGVSSFASVSGFVQTRGGQGLPVRHVVRGVIATALSAYTVSGGVITITATGALAANDGITYAAGDYLLLPDGIAATATDAGIYQVTNAGATGVKAVLTPAADWPIGGLVRPGDEVYAYAGTLFAGTTWVVTNTATCTVGTTAITFMPRIVCKAVTLTSSAVTITTMPVASATQTQIVAAFQAAGGTTTSTIGYGVVAAPTAGPLGTCSFVVDALASGMGKNGSSDASTLVVTVTNPV